MILKGLKEKSNKNYINSQLKKRVILQSNAKIKRIGVIFNSTELKGLPDFNSLIKIIKNTEASLQVMEFKSDEKEESVLNSTSTLKDIGWRGVIKNKDLKQFVNTEFDMLISYYKEDVTSLKLITVASKAKLKVGIFEVDERINDLIIKTKIDDFSTFTSELKKYLNILNKI